MFRVCKKSVTTIMRTCTQLLVYIAMVMTLNANVFAQREWERDEAERFQERAQRMKLNKLVEVLRLNEDQELRFRKTYNEQQRIIDDTRRTVEQSAQKLQEQLRSKAGDATPNNTQSISFSNCGFKRSCDVLWIDVEANNDSLLYGNALCKIAWFVHITSSVYCYIVG